MATSIKYPLSAGTGWTNPTNALTDDGSYATLAFPKTTPTYNYFYNFDFQIPTGATINSVTIECQYKVSVTTSTPTMRLASCIGTTLRGTEKTDTTEPTSDTVISTNLTGTWTAAELNSNLSTGFQIRIGGDRGSSNTAVTGSVDYVKATVDYTAAAPIVTGAANSTFTSTFSLTGIKIAKGATSQTWTSTFSLTGIKLAKSAGSFAGGSSFQAIPVKIAVGSGSLTGGSTMSMSGEAVQPATIVTGSGAAVGGSIMQGSALILIRSPPMMLSGGSIITLNGLQVVKATGSITESSTMQATGTKISKGTASFSGGSIFQALTKVIQIGAGLLNSGATLLAAGKQIVLGSGSATDNSVLSATPTRIVIGSGSLSDDSTFSASGTSAPAAFVVSDSGELTGASVLEATGVPLVFVNLPTRVVIPGTVSFSVTLTGNYVSSVTLPHTNNNTVTIPTIITHSVSI